MHPLMEIGTEIIALVKLGTNISKNRWPDEPVDFRQRFVLRTMREEGPMTLSGLARSRHVTRQHARKTVQAILKSGFIMEKPNPARKRSMLIGLTPEGLSYINRIDTEAGEFLELIDSQMKPQISHTEITTVLRVLRQSRSRFETWLLNKELETDKQLG